MICNLYVVYDRLAQESGPIFECKNHGVARRAYDQMIAKTGRMDEYQLICLGSVNHDNQRLDIFDIPVEVKFDAGGSEV